MARRAATQLLRRLRFEMPESNGNVASSVPRKKLNFPSVPSYATNTKFYYQTDWREKEFVKQFYSGTIFSSSSSPPRHRQIKLLTFRNRITETNVYMHIVNISIRDDDMKPFSRNELARWRVGITGDLFFSSTTTRESSKVALSGYEFGVFDKNKFASCEIKTWKLNQAQQIIDWVTLFLLLLASDRCFCTIQIMNVAVSQPESLVNHSFFPIDRVADLHKSSPKINWWEKG